MIESQVLGLSQPTAICASRRSMIPGLVGAPNDLSRILSSGAGRFWDGRHKWCALYKEGDDTLQVPGLGALRSEAEFEIRVIYRNPKRFIASYVDVFLGV